MTGRPYWKPLYVFWLGMVLLPGSVFSQEETDRWTPDRESLERIAARLMEAQDKKLQRWTEEHAARWEQWAKKLEREWEAWAGDQEAEWNAWARQAEKQMEGLARELKSAEINSDQVRSMLEQNLEMLSRMPVGKSLDRAWKSGSKTLEEAPLDSLHDLRLMIVDAVKESLGESRGAIEGARREAQLRANRDQLPRRQPENDSRESRESAVDQEVAQQREHARRAAQQAEDAARAARQAAQAQRGREQNETRRPQNSEDNKPPNVSQLEKKLEQTTSLLRTKEQELKKLKREVEMLKQGIIPGAESKGDSNSGKK